MTEAFVIHLARAAARRPQVDRLLAMLPMPARVIDAVDGAELSEREVSAVAAQRLHRPTYPFPLRAQEVGCFLSHRRAWTAIVESDLEAGLIVEDDVAFEPAALGPVLDFARQHMRSGDYVRLPYRSHGESGREIEARDGMALVEPRVVGLGMQMQLVEREAARKLLAATERFDRPVDTTLQLRWLTGVRMLVVRPVVIREIGGTLGGTLVQKKSRTAREVLSRELGRAIYRMKLRLASARAAR